MHVDRHGQSVYDNELESDPRGIGFAFGGVEPGRLHAHGQLVEIHRVHYSIARCGAYKLHVALRHESVELPGSPFALTVTAGPASAVATTLPADALPLTGEVGPEKDGQTSRQHKQTGCHCVMRALDRMGNQCQVGGASVVTRCDDAHGRVTCNAVDLGDGRYHLKWSSTVSGVHRVSVTIDGEPIKGGPFILHLTSGDPDVSKTELSGSGLTKVVAGKPGIFNILCRDRYGNATPPGSSLRFELSLLPAPEAVLQSAKLLDKSLMSRRRLESQQRMEEAEAWPCETIVRDDSSIEMRYLSRMAGDLELHVWVLRTTTSTEASATQPDQPKPSPAAHQPLLAIGFLAGAMQGAMQGAMGLITGDATAGAAGGDGASSGTKPGTQREALPGSPFTISSMAGRAHAAGSRVQGLERVEKKGDVARRGQPHADAKKVPKPTEDGSGLLVHAGDTVVVAPKICDKLGNDTAAPEGDLTVTVRTPEGGEPLKLALTVSIKQGLTRYEAKYSPTACGAYLMHVCLTGAPIAGSPIAFACIPGVPEVHTSKLSLPHQDGIPDNITRDRSPDHVLLYTNVRYEAVVRGIDGCGNALDRGGSRVVAKILGVNGTAPSKTGDNDFLTLDHANGTYTILFERSAPADLKVTITIDGRELKLIFIDFVRSPEETVKALAKQRDEQNASKSGSSKAATAASSANLMKVTPAVVAGGSAHDGHSPSEAVAKLKASVEAVTGGFGAADERRPRVYRAEEMVDLALDEMRPRARSREPALDEMRPAGSRGPERRALTSPTSMETEKELGEASCISEKEIRKEMPRELGEAGRKLQKAEHEVLSMIQLAREGGDVRPKNTVAVAVDAFAAAGQAKAKKGVLQGGGGGTGLITTLQALPDAATSALPDAPPALVAAGGAGRLRARSNTVDSLPGGVRGRV